MFWDGTRWVTERPRSSAPTPPITPRRRFRDWLATGVMLLGLVALTLPLIGADAAVRLSVDPANGTAGQQVTVSGTGFRAYASIQLLWDGSGTGLPKATATRRGTISTKITIPKSATTGKHAISVRSATGGTTTAFAARSSVVVTAAFTVAPVIAAGLPSATTTVGSSATAAPGGSNPAPPGGGAPGAGTGPVLPTDPPDPTPTAGLTGTLPTFTPAPPTFDPTSGPTAGPAITPAPVRTAAPTNPPPAPTPRPPSPTPVPVPDPTPNGTVYPVPGSIDSGGGNNVTSALQSFIDGVPNGATVRFAAGGEYRINGTIRMYNRSGLILDGNGATVTSPSDRGNASLFQVIQGGGVTVRNFRLDGGRTNPGTYLASHEFEFAVDSRGGAGVIVENSTIVNWGGDAVYFGYNNTGSGTRGTWSKNGIVRNNTINGTGRMGIAVTAGTNITVSHNSIDRVALQAIDMEPDDNSGGINGILVDANTIRRYGLSSPAPPPWFFTADIGVGQYDDITIRNNVFIGMPMYIDVGRNHSNVRRSNVTITGNSSDTAAKGAIIFVWHVDGVVVTNNDQPVTSGASVSISDCTGVTNSGN